MDNRLIVKEVALCTKSRCPILVLQQLGSDKEMAMHMGLLEACIVGCLLHEDGEGAERCTAFLAAALEEADGTLVDIEFGQATCGGLGAELVFRRDDGSTRRQRCMVADAAAMAVAFGVPLTLRPPEEEQEGSDDLDPARVVHWLRGLSPEDFEGLGEESSEDTSPE